MNIYSNNKIPFGLKNGVMVEVSDVERGLRCDAVCPSCMRPLQARKGHRRAKHFSHDPSYETQVCESGFETSIHRMAKQILSEEGFSITPELVIKESKSDINGVEHKEEVLIEKEETRHFQKVELEKRIDPIRPDIVAYTEDYPLLIEVAVTNFSNRKKKEIIRGLGFYAIEIDLSSINGSITKEELREMLKGPNAKRKWLSNPKFKAAKIDLIARLDEKVRQINNSISKARQDAFDRTPSPRHRQISSPLPIPEFITTRISQQKQYDPRWFFCESCRHVFDVPLRDAPYGLEKIPCPACNYKASTKTYRA